MVHTAASGSVWILWSAFPYFYTLPNSSPAPQTSAHVEQAWNPTVREESEVHLGRSLNVPAA